MPKPLADRIALVTGASRGIGACGRARARASRRACRRGRAHRRRARGTRRCDPRRRRHPRRWCRSTSRTTPASTGSARALHERYGKLDILVGNAGILGALSPLGHVEPKAWDDVMAVNVTANWRLIRSMDPLLRQSDAGRAVFITSGAAATRAPIGAPTRCRRPRSRCSSRTYAAETAIDAGARQPVQPRADPHPMRARRDARARTR